MIRCTHCFSELLDLTVFCPRCGRPKEPALDRLLNRSLGGRYHLYRRLGEGGLATVFAATDTRSDRIVAVKVSDPRQLVQREFNEAFDLAQARRYWNEMLERMQREAVALAAIHHPHIVRLLDTDLITPELRYVVMEFLHGRTLREELQARGRLGVAETIRIIEAITSGLSVVHARGIIHRDLNPRNIFLCSAEETGAKREQQGEEFSPSAPLPLSPSDSCNVKIIDFGIAKIPPPPGEPPFTQHSIMSGTVAYASPEQCQNGALDHRSDIYSLGVMIYEMVTGERPFRGRTAAEIALKQIQAEPISPRALVPDLPATLEAAILRALAKSPSARQQSVEELMAEVRQVGRRLVVPLKDGREAFGSAPPPISFHADESTIADNNSIGQREEASKILRLRLIRKRRRRMALVAAGIVVALAVSGWLFAQHWLSIRPATKAPLAFDPVSSPGVSPTRQLGGAAQLNPAGDADALEMAARSSILEPGQVSSPALPGGKTAPSPASKGANSSFLPPPVLPQARPQSLPSPGITAMPNQPPTDQTASAVDRQPTPTPTTRQRETDQAPSVDGQPEAADYPRGQEATSSSGGERSNYTPPPEPPSEADDRPPVRTLLGPKVITWSGRVIRERKVTLELPGLPGMVEIPRKHSKRVGMIEPPSPDNNWRRVVLRVFGDGQVFFVIRWWPSAPNAAPFTARR